jgi:hypothetical protein
MLENTIEEVLSTDPITRKIFKGCISRDELPKSLKSPSCYVINTKPRNHQAEHWLAIHNDKLGNCFFFDSYGLPPNYYNLETTQKA